MLRDVLHIAASIYKLSKSCESEHSWAWIEPSGKFHEVEDHGYWAMENLDERQVAKLMKGDIVQDFWTRIGFEYPEMVQEMLAGRGDTDTAPGLETVPIHKLPPSLVAEAEALELPTLSTGQWDPRKDRLTKEEERFLASHDHDYATEAVVKVSALNQKKQKAWKERYQWLNLRGAASQILTEEGWLRVANAFSIGSKELASQAQLDSFFLHVLSCWKGRNLRPDPTKEEFHLVIGEKYKTMPYFEAINDLASRKVSELFYEYFLEGYPSSMTHGDRLREKWRQLAENEPDRLPPPSREPRVPRFPAKNQKERLPYRRRYSTDLLRLAAEIEDLFEVRVAVLKHLPSRKQEGKDPWCLVSKKTGRPLQCWPTKPSDAEYAKAEARIQYWKHKG